MKTKITFVIFLFASILNAQKAPIEAGGGEFIYNKSEQPCLTPQQRQIVKQTVLNGIADLKSQNKLAFSESNRGGHPLFGWPIKKASNVTYNNIWIINNYVDHNVNAPDQLTDYNCGSRTYDLSSGYNHQGIDIVSWPFAWKLMDEDAVEIVAAADGQIIAKGDGEYDRNCSFINGPWNAVYVQHSDGSLALYGHMKTGSLTTKNIGEMVTEGEYLGLVGSSGSSTVPHLHFEVYQNSDFTGLIDPYSGSCNSLNSNTWWQTQKPYNNPGINAVLTHSAFPVFNACPTAETTNESNDFDTDDTIYFNIYLRDQQPGTSVNLKIIKPDDSVLYNWGFALTDFYTGSYWQWYYSGVFDMNGEWKWQATYNGETVTHNFNVTGALSIEDDLLKSTSIYPNPFNDIVNINSKNKISKATVVDMSGKTILMFEEESIEGIKQLDFGELSNGMYFVTLSGDQNQRKTIKLIKK